MSAPAAAVDVVVRRAVPADAAAFAAIWAALALVSADALGLIGAGRRRAEP